MVENGVTKNALSDISIKFQKTRNKRQTKKIGENESKDHYH